MGYVSWHLKLVEQALHPFPIFYFDNFPTDLMMKQPPCLDWKQGRFLALICVDVVQVIGPSYDVFSNWFEVWHVSKWSELKQSIVNQVWPQVMDCFFVQVYFCMIIIVTLTNLISLLKCSFFMVSVSLERSHNNVQV